jgi:hypothetical protein
MRNLLIFVYLFFPLVVFGQGTILITDNNYNKAFDLGGNIFYYIDTTSQLTFEQALSNDFFKNYRQSAGWQFNLKIKSNDHWFLIPIENLTSKPHELILSINNPNVQEIIFYSSVDSSFYNTVLFYPFFQRQFPSKNFLFELTIPPLSNEKICIKITGQELPVHIPITLTSSKKYFEELGTYQMVNGLFSGLIVLAILMILLLWMTEKDKIYINLLMLVTNLIILLLLRNQIVFHYLFPYSPRLNWTIIQIFTLSVLLIILILMRNLFNIQNPKRYIGLYYRFVLVTGFVLILLNILFQRPLFFYYGLIAYFILTLIYGVTTFANHEVRSKKELVLNLVSSFIILTAFGLDIFQKLDFKGNGIYDDYFPKTGLIVCFFMITVAFVTKFWNSRIEVFELNKNLEQKVQKRLNK